MYPETNPLDDLKVLFRVDSGIGIGHGHVTRIETLASSFIEAGGECCILTRRLPGARPPSVDLPTPIYMPKDTPVEMNIHSEIEDAHLTIKLIAESNFSPDLVVVDHYYLGATWERKISDSGYFLVALDDRPNQTHDSDITVELIAGTSNSSFLRGLEYLLVSDDFEMPPNPLPAQGWTVLVFFGAEDQTNHSFIALEAIKKLNLKNPSLIFHAHIVVGSAFKQITELQNSVSQESSISLHYQLPTLAKLMQESHVVICAAGNAMVEAIVAGRATIAVVTATNQEVLAESFGRAGVVELFSNSHTATAAGIADKLLGLQKNRRQIAKTNILDTKGADRLASEIKSRFHLNGHGK